MRRGSNNVRHEGLDRRERLIVNCAYGLRFANATLGFIMLTLGPIEHVLPNERRRGADPCTDPHLCREAGFKSPCEPCAPFGVVGSEPGPPRARGPTLRRDRRGRLVRVVPGGPARAGFGHRRAGRAL